MINVGRRPVLCFPIFFVASWICAQEYGHRAYLEAPADTLALAGIYRGERRVQLRAPAAQAFQAMAAAAQKDGVRLTPISGFRSKAFQSGLWKRAIKKYGSESAAARWVAPPGHSEHATGWALDIGDLARPDCDTDPCFEKTAAGRWLLQHASEFGFELSFPKNNPQGVSHEPWHYRYKNDPDAERLFSPQ